MIYTLSKKIYYGAETTKSLKSFRIDKIRLPVIKALALFRQACAMVNSQFGLDQHISNAIVQVCNEILKEGLNDQFPLSAFQPGSGIHANMNINEIIANRAMEIADGMEVGVGV
ncbi:unnamed protein product [Rotaria sordida]|uniref:Fumarate lyase N-terminal domain-containing protein n=1 Tax=Rotaria sordida TaxID=392033 RepID=A0A819UTK8_9BILA|nr:unnamed protein product [Rotaria sordida]CAF4102459.1 unnamed protein product [Rotaria sordida]